MRPPPKNEGKDSHGSFIALLVFMVLVSLGNKVFFKLMTVPMRNYPNFVNLLLVFVAMLAFFAIIIPMKMKGYISKKQLEEPKKPFAIIAICKYLFGQISLIYYFNKSIDQFYVLFFLNSFLVDSMSGILSTFAATYLSGPTIILLQQAAIPVSLILSKYLLQAKYSMAQYLGAILVICGVVVSVVPLMSGKNNPLWAFVLIISTIPAVLSLVFKEKALVQTKSDPMFLNGWVTVFQLIITTILSLPLTYASQPPVPIEKLPENFWDGLKCYVGIDTITCDNQSSNCFPDNCSSAPLLVNLFFFFTILLGIILMYVLKYGGANIYTMASTFTVPLANIAYTLPFMPQHEALRVFDILGLIIVMFGLTSYRYGDEIMEWAAKISFRAKLTDEKPQENVVIQLTTLSPIAVQHEGESYEL